MAALSINTLSDAGTAPTFVAASAGGDTVSDIGTGQNVFLVVKTGATATDVVIDVDGTTDYGVDLPDKTVTVPATSERWIPLRPAYVDFVTRLVQVAYKQGGSPAAASVTISAVKVQ